MDIIKELNVESNITFHTIAEICNRCLGKNYGAYMKAYLICDEKYAAWFPKLANKNGRKRSEVPIYKWINTLSDDGKTITEENEDPTLTFSRSDNRIRFVFAKRPKGEYEFVGMFQPDYNSSTPQRYVYRRIADKADFSMWH